VIHLDTSFLIRAGVRSTPEGHRLRGWLRAGTPVRVSAVVWAEYLCGPVPGKAVEEAAELCGEPVAFGGAEATLAAQMFNATGRRRGTLADCMIAAIALSADAAVATSNPRDFERFGEFGVVVEG
jgi:predicted nucleic acid-binding protein